MTPTQPENRREIGEFGVADPLRDGEAGYGDAGNEVGLQELEGVARTPFENGKKVLKSQYDFPRSRLVLELTEWIVGEECLFQRRLERFRERLRRWNLNTVDALHPRRRVLVVAVSHAHSSETTPSNN